MLIIIQQELQKLIDCLNANLILKTKFFIKIRDIHKIEERNCIVISTFGYESEEKYPLDVSKNTFKHNVDLILQKKQKKCHVFIKDFNTFMYNHSLHRGRQGFCPYSLQAFNTKEILKCHINDCFKINGAKD